jgi:Family of unknown function (DUF6263)
MVRRVLATLGMVCALCPLAQAQVKLAYKVPEGMTILSKSGTKVDQVMTIQGMDVKTLSEEESVANSTVGARKADGTVAIEVTIQSLKAKFSIAGMEFALDTEDKDSKIDLPQLAFLGDVFKALKGANYTVVLDAKDNVKFVEGTEKNLTKANNLPEQAVAALKSRFDADRIKKAFEQSHGTFPDGLVREGEPWERTETSEIGGGQTLTFKKRYEYKGTVKKGDKTLDKIDIKALDVTYKMDPNTPTPAKVTKSDLKVASAEGTLLFDREAGALVERHEKIRMTGDMTLVIQEMELPIKLDLTLESTTAAEHVKK